MGCRPGLWDGSQSSREESTQRWGGPRGWPRRPRGMESGLGEGSGYPGGAGPAYREKLVSVMA